MGQMPAIASPCLAMAGIFIQCRDCCMDKEKGIFVHPAIIFRYSKSHIPFNLMV
jgi:hypothetical protein